MTRHVQSLSHVSVTVSDLGALTRFYCDGLGFSCLDSGPVPAVECRVLGLDGGARRARLQLGDQRLELLCPARLGQAYPADSRATDGWFQHIALVVSDMDAAYARVCEHAIAAISAGGPQRLPLSSGGVCAFKFRDPDGHPLELIAFPAGSGDPRWQQPTASGPFLGIDHSAIVVQDAERSIAFYAALGLSVTARGINRGPEQERLDGVPDVVAEVVALQPGEATTPHVELLAYRQPAEAHRAQALGTSDLASARLMFVASDGTVGREGGMVLQHDPDGHAFVLVPAEGQM
jgi:catechol 2,3-dioxygenase-like lactoylglutathione lyase family enzyme